MEDQRSFQYCPESDAVFLFFEETLCTPPVEAFLHQCEKCITDPSIVV
jgi:hypothetical protein